MLSKIDSHVMKLQKMTTIRVHNVVLLKILGDSFKLRSILNFSGATGPRDVHGHGYDGEHK